MSEVGSRPALRLTCVCSKDDDPRSPSTVCKLDLLDPEESNDAVFDEQYK